MCELLVEHNADVAARTRCHSPLHACYSSFPHFLRCRGTKTALKWAIDYKKTNVIAYLRSIGAPQ